MTASSGDRADQLRQLAQQFFDARDRYDPGAIAELLTDDATYIMPSSLGQDVTVGRAETSRALGGGKAAEFFDVPTIRRETLKIIADDTTAIGLTTMTCSMLNGAPYRNEYAWQLEFSGDRIRAVKEYTDSLNFARALGIVAGLG